MWSSGIVMFELITGVHPFYKIGDNKQSITDKLSKIKEFQYPSTVSTYA